MLRVVGLSCLAIFTACGQVPTADDALMTLAGADELSQIRGGADDPVKRGVVGLAMMTQQGGGGCSGSLIAPNVVLTARHCVAQLTNADRGVDCRSTSAASTFTAHQVFVTLEQELGQNPRAYVSVEEIRVPSDPLLCNTDIALMKLAQPVRASDMPTIIPRIDSPVRRGESYTIVGYGGTDDNGTGAGQRRIAYSHTATCVGTECPRWSSLSKEWAGDGGVCQGDSGGPAIDSKGRVIGVASRGGQLCSTSIYSGIDSWADWIRDWTIQWTREENVEIPLWADGWPTDPAFNAAVGGLCEEPSDCGAGDCVDGYCTRACEVDSHCPESFDCHSGWCLKIPQPTGAECRLDVDCESYACMGGECQPGCTSHSDCPANQGCNANGMCDEGTPRSGSRGGGGGGGGASPRVPNAFGCAGGATGLWLLPIVGLLRRRRRRA